MTLEQSIPLERRIETALETHLRAEGWHLYMVGDHFAEHETQMPAGAITTTTINVTECAKDIAREIAPC